MPSLRRAQEGPGRRGTRRASRLPHVSPRLITLAVGSAFAAVGSSTFGNPTGPSVASGSASFVLNGKTLTVTNTPGAIINWQQFSIQKDELTRFIQQHASSAVLNRVVSGDPSVILGVLSSNGRVFLINPAGLTIGAGATIDVAGFTASTLNLTDADFVAGRLKFQGSGAEGRITNAGTIRTLEGGQVFLIAPSVENSPGAVISSPRGEVVIAAGKTVELVNSATPEIRVEYTAAGEAVNAGEIVASSGRIGIYGTLVKNSGLVSASRAELGEGGRIVLRALKDVTLDTRSKIEANGARGGRIEVKAETGTLLAQGTIEAKGEEAKGGEIQLLGTRVAVTNAQVNASGATGGGTILVGGDFQGRNAAVQNASRTLVTSTATLKADATRKGDGGKVIVWAEGDARFAGTITAQGGPEGGDGGFVEVSGKETLSFTGTVDTSAPLGATGQLLLDPGNITIAAGTVNTPAFEANAADGLWAFGEDSGNQTIGAANVSAILNNTNLTLQASGNITISNDADINYSNTPTRSFTLTANESITMGAGANVRATGNGALNVTFTADNDGNQVGGISIGGGANTASILTNGGNIVLGGSGSNMAFGTASTNNIGVQLFNASLVSGAGNITIRGNANPSGTGFLPGVQVNNTLIQANGGVISISGNGAGSGNALGVQVTTSATIETLGAGNVSITGVAGSNANSPGVELLSGATVRSLGNGSVLITGTGSPGGSSSHGVTISGSTVSTAANGRIQITGTAGTGDDGRGVSVSGGSNIASTGTSSATISITGNAGNASAANQSGTMVDSSTIYSQNAPMTLVGNAGNAGTNAWGFNVFGAGSGLIANGSANISVTGTVGSGATTNSVGVVFGDGSNNVITIGGANSTGTISVTGTPGGSGTAVEIFGSGTNVSTGGSGAITIAAIGGQFQSQSSISSNSGAINISANGQLDLPFNATVTSTSGSISLGSNQSVGITSNARVVTGGSGNIGISAANGTVTAANVQAANGSITITGNSVNSTGLGVSVGQVTTTGSGNISITGRSANSIGVYLASANVSSTNGSIGISGAGGVASGNSNVHGIFFSGATVQTSGSGQITLTGIAGTTDNGSAQGISFNAGTIQSAGGGNIILSGNGGTVSASSDTFPHGIFGPNTVVQSNGSIQITGIGGNGSGSSANVGAGGVILSTGFTVQTGGSQNITISGNGGTATGTSGAPGVSISGANVTAGGSGSIVITGNGGVTAGTGNATGAGVSDTGIVQTSGTGQVFITGTGGNATGTGSARGVIVAPSATSNGATVQSGSGNITITGTGGTVTTGSALAIRLAGANTAIGGATSGAITLVGDTMDLGSSGGVNVSTTGTLTVRPQTASREIEIGAGANETAKLGLADTEIVNFFANNVVIGGSPQAGNLTVVGLANFSSMGSGGTLTLQAGNASGPGHIAVNETLTAPGNVTLSTAAGNISFGQPSGNTGISAAGKTVTLQASAGRIEGTASGGTDIVADTANLQASTGIGATNAIDTTVANLALSTATGDARVINTTGVNLAGVSVSAGNLVLTANGAITDTAATAVSGTATFNAGATSNDITLDHASNDFNTVVIATAGNVILRDSNAIALGASTVSGNLSVTSNGAITGSGALAVTGTATFNAQSNGNVSLGDTSNDFSTVVISSANSVTIEDQNSLILGNASFSGAFTANARAGDLTISGDINRSSGSGTQSATFLARENVLVSGGANIRATSGSLNVTLNADTNSDGGGIQVGNGVTVAQILSNGGSIILGGGTGAANHAIGTATTGNAGVLIYGGTLTSSGGSITIKGQGLATGAGARHYGVGVVNGAAVASSISSGAGNINISGIAGNGALGDNVGVKLDGFYLNAGFSAANVSSTTGDIAITGVGENNTGIGVHLRIGGRVLTSGGNVVLNGTGVRGVTLDGFLGVGSHVQTTGNGTVTITGSSNGTTGTDNTGVAVLFSNSSIQTVAGNITITGTGGSGGTDRADGVAIGGATITTGSGTISIVGTGGGTSGTNDGIRLDTEIASGLGGTIQSTGAGNIIVTGTAGSGGSGIGSRNNNGSFTNRIGGAAMTGDVTLVADSMDLSFSATQIQTTGAGTLRLRPSTAANAITLGTGAADAGGTLGLSDIEVSHLFANNVVIGGGSQAGNIAVVGAASFANMGSGGTLTLQTTGAATFQNTVTTAGNVSVSAGTVTFGQGAANGIEAGATKTVTISANEIVGNAGAGKDVFAGAANLTASAGNIGATEAIDLAVSNVSLSATGAANLTNSGALNLDSVSVGGNLGMATGGAITQTGGISAAGTATLSAGAANDITLNVSSNDFGTVVISSGNNVVLRDANGLTLGAVSATNALTVTAGGDILSSGNVVAGGTATFNAPVANAITLGQAGNDFNTVVIQRGGNTTLVDSGSIVLGTSNVSGTLSVTANGTIAQSGSLTVSGLATFDTSANTTIGAVTLNTGSAVTLQNSTVGGNLTVNTASGNITIAGGNNVNVVGDATLNASGQVVVSGNLNVAGNQTLTGGTASTVTLGADTDIDALGLASGGNYTIQLTRQQATFDGPAGSANVAVTLGNSSNSFGGGVRFNTGTQTFNTFVANTYNLGQTANVTLGTLTITDLGGNGARGNATLGNAANSFGTVSFNGGSLTLFETGNVTLGSVAANGALSVQATGNISQVSGDVRVVGASTLNAGAGQPITLNTATNDFGGNVTILQAGDVTLRDANAIQFGNLSLSGNFTVTASGNILQSGPGALVMGAGRQATFNAGTGGDVTFNNPANDFSATGNVSVPLANTVRLADTNNIRLGTSNVRGDLYVTATNDGTTNPTIIQSGLIEVVGLATFTVAPNTKVGSAEIVNSQTISVATSNVGGDLTITVDPGDINFPGGAGNTVVVKDDVTLTAANGSVNLGAGGNRNVGGSTSYAGSTKVEVVLKADTAIDDPALKLGSKGDITINLKSTDGGVTGGTNENANAVELTNAGNKFNAISIFTGNGTPSGSSNNVYNLIQNASVSLGTRQLTITDAGGNGTVRGNAILDVASTFGNLSFTGGDLVATHSGNMTLGNISTNALGASTGALTLISTGGTITQVPGTSISAVGATTLNGPTASSITLNAPANNFQAVSIEQGGAVTLVDANSLQLGNSTVTGNLTITATTGANQVAGSSLSTAGLRLLGNGAFSFTEANTSVATLAANLGTGSLDVTSNSSMAVGNVAGTIGVTLTGPANLAVTGATGDLTIARTIQSNGSAISLAAGRHIIFSQGAGNVGVNSGAAGATLAAGSANTSGSIQGNATVTSDDVRASSLSATANASAGEIGQTAALQSNLSLGGANTLTLSAGGNIVLTEANALPLASVTVSGNAPNVTLTSTSGPITVGASNFGSAGANLTLIVTAGNIVGGTGNLAADILTLHANGAAAGVGNSTVAVGTTANTLLGTANSGGFRVAETDDLALAGITTTSNGNVSVSAAGNLSVTAAVNAGGTGETRLSGAYVVLGNDVGLATNAITRIDATTGDITQTVGFVRGASVALTANTGVGGAGSIATEAGNLAASAANGNIAVSELNALFVTTVDGVVGMNAGASNVTIAANGAVTQNQPVVANGLALTNAGAATSFDLTGATNNVAVFAAQVTNAGGNVKYRDAGDFEVGTVGAVTGVTANQNVTFNTGGTVTQAPGAGVAASGLELLGTGGTYVLTQTNNVATIAGDTGQVQFTNGSNALAVGTVNTIGLTTSDANGVVLIAGPIDLAANLNAGAGDVRLSGANVTQSGGVITAGNLAVQAVNGVSLGGGNNASVVAIANSTSGGVLYRDVDGFQIDSIGGLGAMGATSGVAAAGQNVTFNVGGQVTQASGANVSAAGLELLGVSGDYRLTDANNTISTIAGNTALVQFTNNGALTVGTVNTTGLTTTGGNGIVLVANSLDLSQNLSAGAGAVRLAANTGNVVQTGGNVVAGNLGVRAVSGISLTEATNNAGTVALVNSTSGNVSYTDVDGFSVGSVAALGAFIATSGANAPAQNLTFNAGGAVTQTQPITASGLRLSGGGNYSLTDSANAISTLAADHTGGLLRYTDADGFSVGAVDGVSGINIGASDATLSTVAGTISQANAIVANGLALTGGGNFNLQHASNSVSILAANSSTTNPSFYTDVNTVDIGTVDGVVGVTLTGGNLTLTTTGLTQNNRIAVSGLELLVNGTVDLTNASNDVSLLAGNVTGQLQYTDANSFTVGTLNSTGLKLGANATLYALGSGNLTVSQPINASGSSAQTLQLQANSNVIFSASGNVYVTGGNPAHVEVNADRDGGGAGAISFASGTGITSNNGNITLGGGATPGSTAAFGVDLNAATLNSGSGAISIRGNGTTGAGVLLSGATVTSGSGNITLTGHGAAGTIGVSLASGANVSSSSGTVTLYGTAASGTNAGVQISASKVESTGTGELRIAGDGSGTAADVALSSSTIGGASANGNISLVGLGTGGVSSTGSTIQLGSASTRTVYLRGAGITQSGGNIIAANGSLALVSTAGANVASATNDVATFAANVSSGDLAYTDASGFSIAAVSGRNTTDGVSWSTDTVVGIANPGGTTTLTAGGAVTQVAGSNTIVTGDLLLLGTSGTYSLPLGNDITGNLAANTGAVSFNDANSLTVGTVGSTNGITTTGSTTGNVVLATQAAGNLTVSQPISTANGGAVRFLNTGVLTLDADVTADGPVSQESAGAVTITGPRSITTTGDAVSFASAVTLAGTGTTIDTTANSNAAGANVTFNSAILGTTANSQSLSVNAGTGGDVQFASSVGNGAVHLNTLTIVNANDLTFNGTVDAFYVAQQAGTGTTTIGDGAADVMTAYGNGVSFSTDRIVINAPIVATGQNIVFNAANGVTQAGGNFTSNQVVLTGVGSFDISQPSNNVTVTLAADITGNLQFTNLAAITVGTVNAINGVTTNNGSVAITSLGGNIVLSQPLNAGIGGVVLNANGPITGSALVTGSQLTMGNTGTTTAIGPLNTAASGIDARATTGNIGITNTKALVDISNANAGGLVSISTSNAMVVSGSGVAAGTGNVTLTSGTAGAGGMNIGASVTGPAGVTLTVQTDDGVLNHTAGTVGTTNADLDLVADEMFLQAGVNSIQAGTGNITVRPFNATDLIQLGRVNATDDLAANALELSSSELNALGTSNTLVIGGPLQTGAIQTVGAAAISNAAGNLLVNTAGNINVQPGTTLTFSGASGNMALTAGDRITGDGTLSSANLSLNAANGIGVPGSFSGTTFVPGTPVNVTNVTTLSAVNSTSGGIAIRATSGDLNLLGAMQNSGTGGIELQTVDGSINTGAAAFSTAGPITLIANDTGGAPSTITVGPGGMTSTGAGRITLVSADDMAINGNIASNNNAVLLVAGAAPGMQGGAEAVPTASEPADTDGGVTLAAQIAAGSANVTIYSTETVLQTPGSIAGGAGGILNAGGRLTVRTFNDTPGGAPIDLQNDNATIGNFSGDLVLETRMANDTTAPNDAGVFSASNIDYRSFSGLVISGLGTSADFVAISASQNVDFAAIPTQARNITLIANAGDVNINLPIDKSKVFNGQDGGSLNLLANGSVNINAISANGGVSIGQRIGTKTNPANAGEPLVEYFNHDLKLVATGNILIEGGIYVSGNLSLRADASPGETASRFATPAPGDGVGGVIVRNTSSTETVEVRGLNLTVGASGGGANFPVEFLSIQAGSNGAVPAGANVRVDSILRAGIPTTETDAFTANTVTGGDLNIFVTKGIDLVGGNISAQSSGSGQVRATAIAAIVGSDIVICGKSGCNPAGPPAYDAANTIRLTGGTASASNTLGGGAIASATAAILASDFKRIVVDGDLILIGGSATAVGSAQPAAQAVIDPTAQLDIITGGNVILQAGMIAGGNAAASAQIRNAGFITLRIGGAGGAQYLYAPDNMLLGPGLILIGAPPDTGLFSGSPFKQPVPGTAIPITVSFTQGSIFKWAPLGAGIFADAAVLSGVNLFDSSLLNYIIFAANEETQASRIRRGIGTGDDLGAPACQ